MSYVHFKFRQWLLHFFSHFTAVCDDLLLHNNVRLLSKGWILKRFLAVRKDLEMFLLE